jgi:hypothetical protein
MHCDVAFASALRDEMVAANMQCRTPLDITLSSAKQGPRVIGCYLRVRHPHLPEPSHSQTWSPEPRLPFIRFVVHLARFRHRPRLDDAAVVAPRSLVVRWTCTSSGALAAFPWITVFAPSEYDERRHLQRYSGDVGLCLFVFIPCKAKQPRPTCRHYRFNSLAPCL